VEHVQPQNPEKGTETWIDEDLQRLKKNKDSFGNLALISISSNSSYNNQLPSSKRFDFIKKTQRSGIESLKLVDIYSSRDEWTIQKASQHNERMLKVLENYYETFIPL
jgi:hypothetical protein